MVVEIPLGMLPATGAVMPPAAADASAALVATCKFGCWVQVTVPYSESCDSACMSATVTGTATTVDGLKKSPSYANATRGRAATTPAATRARRIGRTGDRQTGSKTGRRTSAGCERGARETWAKARDTSTRASG